MSPFSKKFISAIFWLTLLSGVGCGLKKNGQGVAPNDPSPRGIRLFRGSFFGMSGQSVSGTAVIYSTGSNLYTLALQGMMIPSEVGLQADIYGSTQRVARLPITPLIRSGGGTKNFSFSTNDANFSTVYIFSVQTNRFYGSAQLL